MRNIILIAVIGYLVGMTSCSYLGNEDFLQAAEEAVEPNMNFLFASNASLPGRLYMTFSGKYDDPDTIGLLQYYGTFSDYVIFMQAGAGCAISEVEIGGRMFRWGMYPLVFYAYRNGETFTLQEVYEAGNITEEDLDTILQRHKEYFATVHHWNYDTP